MEEINVACKIDLFTLLDHLPESYKILWIVSDKWSSFFYSLGSSSKGRASINLSKSLWNLFCNHYVCLNDFTIGSSCRDFLGNWIFLKFPQKQRYSLNEDYIHLSGTFLANYRDFLGSYFFFQFSTIINIFQMKSDVICRAIKQHTHSFLGTPNRLILIIDLSTLFLFFYLKD